MGNTQPVLAGIDVGASSIKAVLVDAETGSVLGTGRSPVTVQSPRPGWAEMDAETWLLDAGKALQEAAARANIPLRSVASIGLSGMCPAFVPLGRDGRALRRAILFFDRRSLDLAERIRRDIGEGRFFAVTGNRVAAGTISVTSMLWVQAHEQEVWKNARYLAHANTYLGRQLTGRVAMDWTNASLTGLFETAGKGRWSEALASELGIDPALLPEVVAPSTLLGGLGKEAAAATGLPTGIPVAIGAADTAASALAVGVLEPGQVFESSGTSLVITTCIGKPEFDPRFLNRCHVATGRWLAHGAMSAGGASLRWFHDEVVTGAVALGRGTRAGDNSAVSQPFVADPARSAVGNQLWYDLMEREACKAPPGAGGLIFLPYLSGERSPIWDPLARGAFIGISLATRLRHLIRAVMEGVAYAERQILELAEAVLGAEAEQLLSVGGASHSKTWTQIKADVLQLPILVSHVAESAATGAALLGGVAAGVYAGENEAAWVARQSLEVTSVTPNPSLRPVYDGLYETFSRLYPALREEFAALQPYAC
ncbi:MAG: FGGY family carbohydrate kinase [Bacillota bacterium]